MSAGLGGLLPLFSSILRDSRAGGTQLPPARFARFISSLCLCASVLLGAALPGAPVAHADALLLGASTATSTFGQPVLFRAQEAPPSASVEFSDGATTLATTTGASFSYSSQTVALGSQTICVVDPGGGVLCWDSFNNYGELGDGTTTPRFTPDYVSGLNSGVIAVGSGPFHTCALTNTGGLKCWGWNFYGQIGSSANNGTDNPNPTPVDVTGLTSGVAAMAMGDKHTCALTVAGGVKCWGDNSLGQLGVMTNLGQSVPNPTPVDVTGLTSGVTAIAAGGFSTCALTIGGGVKCWGELENLSPTPVDVSGLESGVVAIAVGGGRNVADDNVGDHACAVTSAGGLKCWGSNSLGQLGDGTTTSRLAAADVSGLSTGALGVTAGAGHTCAIVGNPGFPKAYCWGSNNLGQLGEGHQTFTNRLTPTVMASPFNGQGPFVLVAEGDATLGFEIGSRVYGWGDPGPDRWSSSDNSTPLWVTAAHTPLLVAFADFQVATLSVGTHNITATNENGVTSNALVLTVNQGATTIDLSPSSNPSTLGSLTLTATVTPSGASGTVTFNIDGTNQSTLGTLSGGVATFDASGLPIGSHSIYAIYNGDGNYVGSTSSVLTQVVQGVTTTSVGSSLDPSKFGQSVTFTATVTATPPASGTPTGTVTFMDSATSLGPGTLSGGVATLSTSSLAVGGHTISVVYGGDSNFMGSTSSGVTQTVNLPNAPTVASISPMSGRTAGGTSVAIGGAGFTGATAVQFGGASASFTFNSDSSITATSPAGSGTVDVTVTTGVGASATGAADGFTYIAAPTVTAIAPSSGPGRGGRVVTITGTNFSGATVVSFGGSSATFLNVASATRIVAGSPPGSGTVDVTVTAVGGTSATSPADQFTYIPQPAVTAISPNSGSPSGGTAVTITGANFTGATAVRFGSNAATSVTVNSITKITATSPAGTGTVDVTVTAAGGTSPTGSADQFTYGSARTWVSGTGDNTSQCTVGAPCLTFAAAMALTLPGGEIDALDQGDFGPVTITKSLSIVGGRNVVAAVSLASGGTSGVTIAAGVNDVVELRGLIFDGFAGTGASGVVFTSGAKLNIEDCTFLGFPVGAITFSPGARSAATAKMFVSGSNIFASGIGVVISPNAGIAADAWLIDTNVDGNSGDGLVADGTGGGGPISVVMTNASIGSNAGNGVNAMSGAGSVAIEISRSTIEANGLAGIRSSGASANVTADRSQISDNGVGLQSAGGGSLLSYSNNQVMDNGTSGSFTGTIALH